MTPGDIIHPNATIHEIPCEEWTLDFNQTAALARFYASMKRNWTVRLMKADSIPYWRIECGDVTIIDLALTTALRKAREEK